MTEIYWCVAKDNHRALRFYDKNGFQRVEAGVVEMGTGYTEEQILSYIWYRVSKHVFSISFK